MEWNLLMRKTQCHLHLIIHLVKEDKKSSQLNTNNHRLNITNNQYEEPLIQRKARIVPGRRTYLEATRFGKEICVIGDSHLNKIKRNISQKSVNGGKTYFNVFRGATSKRLNDYILPTLHEDHPDVVLLHIGSTDINNKRQIEKLLKT